MNLIIIGNIVAFVGAIFQTIAGMGNNRNKILLAQSGQLACFSVSNFLLGGYAGGIVNALNVIKSYLFYKNKLTVPVKIFLSVLATALGIYFNNLNIIGLVPLFVMLIYMWGININDIVLFKVFVLITMIMYLVYDLYIKSYTSAPFDFASIIANIITIVQIVKSRKKAQQKSE